MERGAACMHSLNNKGGTKVPSILSIREPEEGGDARGSGAIDALQLVSWLVTVEGSAVPPQKASMAAIFAYAVSKIRNSSLDTDSTAGHHTTLHYNTRKPFSNLNRHKVSMGSLPLTRGKHRRMWVEEDK